MIIIPAVDIKGGKVVRLSQGKFNEITVYSHDPVAEAKRWEMLGAKKLHVVDLDGAEKGEMKNLNIIIQIANAVKIPVEMGGGIRTETDIENLLTHGISQVVMGTKVIEDREFLKRILQKWDDKIIVSIDSSRGKVTQHGWTSVSNLNANDFAKELQGLGVKTLIYTDIARDGTLSGPNIKSIKEILGAVEIPVIASGGIAQIEDIEELKTLETDGLAGVIVGKALYENRFDLADALLIAEPLKKKLK